MPAATGTHRLERRAQALAALMQRRTEMIRLAITPPGSRPPFHEQLSRPEALAFWTHQYDTPIGRALREQMTPESQLELETALAEHLARVRHEEWSSADSLPIGPSV